MQRARRKEDEEHGEGQVQGNTCSAALIQSWALPHFATATDNRRYGPRTLVIPPPSASSPRPAPHLLAVLVFLLHSCSHIILATLLYVSISFSARHQRSLVAIVDRIASAMRARTRDATFRKYLTHPEKSFATLESGLMDVI